MSNNRINEPFGVPLLALALPPALVVVAWLAETATIFPVGSRGAGIVALALVLGSALCLWPIFVIVRRLIYIPTTRRWPHVTLLVISIVAFVPAVAFATTLLAGL